jgi:hypothetical protein
VVNQIMSEGDRVYAIGADLATAEGPQKLVFAIRLIGEDRLGVWVAKAGILKLAPVEEMTIHDFDSYSRGHSPGRISSPSSSCRASASVADVLPQSSTSTAFA